GQPRRRARTGTGVPRLPRLREPLRGGTGPGGGPDMSIDAPERTTGSRKGGRSTASLQHRLAERGIDRSLLMLLPAVLFTFALFIYPFAYGIGLTVQPNADIVEKWGGGIFANYVAF